ncbi:MAG: glycosyl transferase [Spirochaetales bacterium]|nr:glycosyl transferase [Spirochaetales bacterium]
MQYGHFDLKNREYVITNPKTPVKWINYIGTLSFGGFVDHTGGQLICKDDPSLNRITKYIQQMPSSDFKGSTLYLRIKNRDSSYRVFSPFFVPTLDQYDLYECHVGLGYTKIISEFYNIHTEATFFVPRGKDCVIWDLKITNKGAAEQEIDVVPVIEYTHPEAFKQFNNADWVPQTMRSVLREEADGRKVLIQYPFMYRDRRINYYTSNLPVSSYDTDRKVFLGDNEYGSWANPLSLHQEELSNSVALRGDNIAALMHHLGKMGTGKTGRVIVQLGQSKSIEKALPVMAEFLEENKIDECLDEMERYWEEFFSVVQVETPDVSMNNMLNLFNQYQCHTTFNWSRYLSYYQLGLGNRGIGFRDSSQDVMGVIDKIPEDARVLMKKLLSVQKTDGSAMHLFFPLSMEGSIGEAGELGRPDYYGDDHLWIILAVVLYLKETGNFEFLKEKIPYYDKTQDGKPLEDGNVLDHMKRGLEFTRKNTGVHGLPLLGYADWNDCVNLRKGAESAFIANLYGKALLEMMDLCNAIGDTNSADEYRTYYEDTKNKFNEHMWDGEWYRRYFDFDGTPLGTRENTSGQIYANGQSWPIISGFATPERAEQAMESLNRLLNTENGIKLSYPGYNGWNIDIGGITSYPPGAKENGGIFLHANPWAMIAETILGNGNRAFQYYNQINPAAKNDIIEQYECEPYVYAQNILGNEHPQFGLGRNSWLSGTASWAYQAGIKYILGILPTFEGLQINPCIPSSWDGFKVKRKFRKSTYRIEVKNPAHVCTGIKSVTCDGKKIEGNILPLFTDSGEHKVLVEMG